MDFVHDAAASGRKFRALSVVDPYTRECLALEVDTSMGSRRVTRVLEGIIAERGAPQAIRCDNGPEFTSRHFLAWCLERKVEVVHIEPGKPVQNAHVESFHGKLRDECLNASWFQNLWDARQKIAAWREEYNEERPHSSLEDMDVRTNPAVGEKVLAFLEEHAAKSVIVTDGIIGCPHEEGIDYPDGKSCLLCPYWAGRDRFTRERIQ